VKIAFAFFGGHKEEWLSLFTDEYVKKIGHFYPVEIIRVKTSRQARASAIQKQIEESGNLLKILKKDDVVVLCDERGEQLNSLQLSDKLVKFCERGKSRVIFVVGGAFGFSDEVRQRAEWQWSLSKLVFNHHVAQAVVLEQIYRAFTIWKNIPYHNE
jgi:23S rRNA (pseudouridine1915-N3)-methyltransferase